VNASALDPEQISGNNGQQIRLSVQRTCSHHQRNAPKALVMGQEFSDVTRTPQGVPYLHNKQKSNRSATRKLLATL